MSDQLTAKQQSIYDYISEQIDRGYPPTIREIGEAFEIKSPNGVMCHLKALEKKGLINRMGEKARAITLTRPRPTANNVVTTIPFLGNVAAGQPLAAVEQNEELDVVGLLKGENHFALQVRGQSMIESHIDDGDYVIIRKAVEARNGENVVAAIDGEYTLKRYKRMKDHIVLEPANSTMAPIVVTPDRNIEIVGVLVGVLRRC